MIKKITIQPAKFSPSQLKTMMSFLFDSRDKCSCCHEEIHNHNSQENINFSFPIVPEIGKKEKKNKDKV